MVGAVVGLCAAREGRTLLTCISGQQKRGGRGEEKKEGDGGVQGIWKEKVVRMVKWYNRDIGMFVRLLVRLFSKDHCNLVTLE